MKIWHISDTHTFHGLLDIPLDAQMVIFSGDCSNPREPIFNQKEVLDFIEWYKSLKHIKYKIFVGGNHDTSIEKGLVPRKVFEEASIIYLENELVEIEGLRIWGSPITPTFGDGWAWNRQRHKIHKYWSVIPENIDILVTHGPPYGILDQSYNYSNKVDLCGCNNLIKQVKRINPQLHLFGHIHNCEDLVNAGTRTINGLRTIFSNGSVVTDGKFGNVSSNGNILEINASN